jgi:GAF domain-containing protein
MIHSVTVPVENGCSPGQLVLLADHPNKTVNSKTAAFLESLAHFIGDAYRWQQSVRQQEQENVPPTVLRRNEFRELSLFDILKDSAQLLGYNAAALYRLDSAEKTLRTSSVWGLPEERLLDLPRFLHDSLADVEAILGQVVVLNEDYLFEVWQTPEDFPMAVCVPIISSSAILGTLWLYADKRQDLTEHELGLLEFVAARIAADWELSLLHRDLRRRQ